MAVGMARAAAPDVILVAVGLPDLDGIEAARAILRSQVLPIILVTSHHDSATIERAKVAGIRGYLIKPLRAAELGPAIELAITRFQDFVSLRTENSTLKENLEARKLIERAKGLLMSQRNLSVEEQAYTLIKKTSVNMRKPMSDVAQAIILDGDQERLKWAGVFFRRQTPGRFMMRLRIPNGFLSAMELRTMAKSAVNSANGSPTSRRGSRCNSAGLPSTTCQRCGSGSKRLI